MRTVIATAAMALAIGTTSFAQFSINEVRTGTGTNEYVEITGTPGASLAGVTFLIVGDGTSSGATPTRTGVVEWKWTFTKADVIGANGFLVLHNPLMALTVDAAATSVPWIVGDPTTVDTGFESSDNQTYLLVSDYSGTDTFVGRAPNQGADGQDLDTNDDGVLDVTPWTAIIDSMSIVETPNSTPGAGQDWWYSANVAGPYISRTVVHATSGDVIAGWDFQTTTNPNNGTAAAALPNCPKVFNSNAGIGTMYLDGTNGSSDWAQATQLNAFTGTGINASGPSGNGLDPATNPTSCLALVNAGVGANGQSAVFKFSMASFIGLNVSYATRTSGLTTGFTTQQWAWSTDGSAWTDLEAISGYTTSFSLKSLAAIAALNGAPDAYLRVTFTGATSNTSNNRLDNVLLFSNPVTTDTVVTNYGAPGHVFKGASSKFTSGGWQVGPGATTDGWDTPGYANYVVPVLTCGDPNAGSCDAAGFNPYCSDECCCSFVCSTDPYCCQVHWDAICVTGALGCATACTTPKCTADLNLDGQVDGADLGMLLGSWNTPDNDLNGDGNVDGADLGQLLGAWGPCPV